MRTAILSAITSGLILCGLCYLLGGNVNGIWDIIVGCYLLKQI
jgi:hypothetical protein